MMIAKKLIVTSRSFEASCWPILVPFSGPKSTGTSLPLTSKTQEQTDVASNESNLKLSTNGSGFLFV